MSHKRASLSLSVNAIVVLILAIVMLGLGMAFIRGMFGKVSETFEQKVAEEPEPLDPSIRTPITMSREHVITHSAETEVIKVAIFNPTNQSWVDAYPDIVCPSGPTMEDSANPKTLDSNTREDYTVKLKATGSSDVYLCEIQIKATGSTPSYSKDITIEVRD
jgi:hypothetical protein